MHELQAVFDFSLPTKIIYGPGVVTRVATEIIQAGGKKVLIVTDKGICRTPILKTVTDILTQHQLDYVVFDGVEANPKDVNCEAGADLARAAGTDCLLAVGGGSPIDCAKSIGVLLAHNATKIKAYEGKTAATKPIPLLITVPTTAGTGSETTFSSVVTDTENHYKMTIKSQYTAAAIAICDPLLTLSVPASITAATGVDALTHAIEGFSATCAEPIGNAVALYAIELIYQHLLPAYQNGQDVEARSGMLMGSLLAGIAFSHADVASVHCIAEALGSLYDLPHGVCNAIFLPYVMAYNKPYCIEKYARVAKAMGLSFDTTEEGASAAVEAVKKLTQDVQLPPFASLSVPEECFPQIAELAEKNNSNGSNPRPMGKEDYLHILRKAHAGDTR